MSNDKINDIKDNIKIGYDQNSMKRPLINDSINEVKRQATAGPGKRYRLLLACAVCNGDAHGYNFDAISCESCKAFFRRNALQPSEKLKCRGNGNCEVVYNQKKRCKKCRLDKCFQTGMRKEWILTEKEKQEKRMKIEQNRRLKQVNNYDQCKTDKDLSIDLKHLSPIIEQNLMTKADCLKIEFIQNAYSEAVRLNKTARISQYPSIQPIESTIELFRVPIYISSMRLITYFKQIPEFQQLDKDEQVYLVKLNTLSIVFLHSIFIYDSKQEVYHEQDTNDPLFSERDWMKTINQNFHYEMKQIQKDLIEIIQTDNHIVKIFFLIMLFSNNIHSKYSTLNIYSLNIFKAQNVYTELFYKYCLHYYGLHNSSKFILQYITKYMKIQRLIDESKSIIHGYMDITQLSPLMQSLL